MTIDEQYIKRRIRFYDYLSLMDMSEDLSTATLSNMLPLSNVRQLNRGRLLPNPEALNVQLENRAVDRVTSILKEIYPQGRIIRTRNHSVLDREWKADLFLFLPQRIGLPIQVKSNKRTVLGFRLKMKSLGNRLRVSKESIRWERDIYIDPPYAMHPGYSAGDNYLLKVKGDLDKLLFPFYRVAA